MNYRESADLRYLDSFENFFNHRMRYFTATKDVADVHLSRKIYSPVNTDVDIRQRHQTVEDIANSDAPIVITTSTKNREPMLTSAYSKLLSQRDAVPWYWLIVDNGSNDGTIEQVSSWNDRRVGIVKYDEITGCAFPVRNFAFDLVQAGLQKSAGAAEPWVMNIDSDDQLYDDYSLHEMGKLFVKANSNKKGVSLTHGYAVWETEDERGKAVISSCPAEVDGAFPEVQKMSDIFVKGLIFLAAAVPGQTLSWLRYPNEISFEDDAVNQKLMLQAMKRGEPWIHADYPMVLKSSNSDTMITQNNQLGDSNKTEVIGTGHVVTGIRADIVGHLRSFRDYYVREGL